MKIVYLHQYFTTAAESGGTRSYEFSRRLVREGHEVHVVTSTRARSTVKSNWTLRDVEGIKVHSITVPYDNSMKPSERVSAFFRFAVLSSVRARSLKGDVVFATSTPLTIAVPAIFATLGRSTPFVMEVRDLWPTVPIALGYLKNPISRFLAKLLERTAYWRASRVIALSKGMLDGVVGAGFNPENVSLIPNVSDTQRFRSESVDSEYFYSQHPELRGRPFILYTGTFGHVNGVEYMVDLAKEYAYLDPDMAFIAIGSGARREAVSAYAESLGVLNKNFYIFDPVPKSDLPNILAASRFCSSWVIPIVELEANSANKLFDAFAAGRPVLINHGGWQDELLTSSGAGLALPASNVEEAARVLHHHASDDSWLESAREASARLGDSHFNVDKLFDEFMHVLTRR